MARWHKDFTSQDAHQTEQPDLDENLEEADDSPEKIPDDTEEQAKAEERTKKAEEEEKAEEQATAEKQAKAEELEEKSNFRLFRHFSCRKCDEIFDNYGSMMSHVEKEHYAWYYSGLLKY